MKPDCRVHGVYHYATADDKDAKKGFLDFKHRGRGARVFSTSLVLQGAWGATKNTPSPKHKTYQDVFSNTLIHEILFLLHG